MKLNSGKLIVILIGIAVAVIFFTIFGIQGIQNKPISYQEQIHSAKSDIKVHEKEGGM